MEAPEQVVEVKSLLDFPAEITNYIWEYLPTDCLFKTASRLCKSLNALTQDVLEKRFGSFSAAQFADYLYTKRRRIGTAELNGIRRGKWPVAAVGEMARRTVGDEEWDNIHYTDTNLARFFLVDYDKWYLDASDKAEWFDAVGFVFSDADMEESYYDEQGQFVEVFRNYTHYGGDAVRLATHDAEWFLLKLAQLILENESWAARFSWSEFTAGVRAHVAPRFVGKRPVPIEVTLFLRAAAQRWFDPDADVPTSAEDMVRQLEEELQGSSWLQGDEMVTMLARTFAAATLLYAFLPSPEEVTDLLMACPSFIERISQQEGATADRATIQELVKVTLGKSVKEIQWHTRDRYWQVDEPDIVHKRINRLVPDIWRSVQEVLGSDLVGDLPAPGESKKGDAATMSTAENTAQWIVQRHIEHYWWNTILVEHPPLQVDDRTKLAEFAHVFRLAREEQKKLDAMIATIEPPAERDKAVEFVRYWKFKPGTDALVKLEKVLA